MLKGIKALSVVLTTIRKGQLIIKDSQKVKQILTQNQVERTNINEFTASESQETGESYEQPNHGRNKQSSKRQHSRFKPVCS